MITQLYAIAFLAPTIAPWSQVTYIYPRPNLKQGIFRMQIEYKTHTSSTKTMVLQQLNAIYETKIFQWSWFDMLY